MDALRKASIIAVKDCMGIKNGGGVLTIKDFLLRRIAFSLWESVRQAGTEVIYTGIKHTDSRVNIRVASHIDGAIKRPNVRC